MAYYVLATIKAELLIALSDTTNDGQLNSMGADSDDYVNNYLNPYFNTPIGSPDKNVIDASNMGAIGRYYTSVGQPDKARGYYQLADRYIDVFLDQSKKTKAATKVPQYFVSTTGNIMTSP